MFTINKKYLLYYLLSASLVNGSNRRKNVSLNNKKCEIQPILIN